MWQRNQETNILWLFTEDERVGGGDKSTWTKWNDILINVIDQCDDKV